MTVQHDPTTTKLEEPEMSKLFRCSTDYLLGIQSNDQGD